MVESTPGNLAKHRLPVDRIEGAGEVQLDTCQCPCFPVLAALLRRN